MYGNLSTVLNSRIVATNIFANSAFIISLLAQSNAFSGTQLLDDALPRTPTNGMSSSLRVATQEQNESELQNVYFLQKDLTAVEIIVVILTLVFHRLPKKCLNKARYVDRKAR